MTQASKLIEEARAVDRELHGAPPPGAGPAQPGAAGPPPAFDPIYDPAAEWAFIPQTVGSVLAMAMPEVAQVYSHERCMQWGQAMHAVAQKRGWSAASMGPEMALAAATLSFVLPTYIAMSARQKKAKERDVTPKPDEPVAPAEEGGGDGQP